MTGFLVCKHHGVSTPPDVYYRSDLAMVHHRGFGAHAAACAPGIIDFLAPVRARQGLVLDLGARIKPFITPSDLDRVETLLRERAGLGPAGPTISAPYI